MAPVAATPTPETIQTLRKRLGESTIEFGARFSRSGRSIEDWEQGRRSPDALCSSLIRRLARERKAAPAAAVKRPAKKAAAKKATTTKKRRRVSA
jgi:DNA-binding transcriptional regulator YiaG